MDQNSIIDTLREAVNYLKDDKVSYEDEHGNIVALEKAMNERTFVRPVDGRVKAQEILSNVGLDINQAVVRNVLSELVSLLGGKAAGGASRASRARLTEDEKRSLVREFHDSGVKNKKKFTDEKDIGYQSFLKWEKEFS